MNRHQEVRIGSSRSCPTVSASVSLKPSKDPRQWSSRQVLTWLNDNGFRSWQNAFEENVIDGDTLCDLEAKDLIELGLKNKKVHDTFFLLLRELNEKSRDATVPKLTVKAFYSDKGDKEIFSFSFSALGTLKQLRSTLTEYCPSLYKIHVLDLDEDEIEIRTDEDLRLAMLITPLNSPLRLILNSPSC